MPATNPLASIATFTHLTQFGGDFCFAFYLNLLLHLKRSYSAIFCVPRKTKNPDFASKSGFYSLLLFFKVVPPGIEPGTQGFSALPSRMTTNKILRQWVEKAGIDKKITYHTSRHTFGTMMMTVGADLYTTCKLMGHADVRTTQIYAKIVDSKKIEAVDMVDKMFEQEEAKD